MLDDDDYACGLNREHVDVLINPANWNSTVRDEKRKPRVFLQARVNQKGNAEINFGRGDYDVLYSEDFLASYAAAAHSASSGPWRGIGELMWWKGYELLVSSVTIHKSPVAIPLLYAHAASLNELAAVLAQRAATSSGDPPHHR